MMPMFSTLLIGQQPLQVVLGDRVENAEKTRNRATSKNNVARPPGPAAEKIKSKAHKSVDRRLQHDPGHQRGNGAGCDGVGPGQPEVERNNAGFGSKSHERHQEDRGPNSYRHRRHSPRESPQNPELCE